MTKQETIEKKNILSKSKLEEFGRKETVGLLHKAAKLKNKFDQYEMM